jgi:hypothetical protein
VACQRERERDCRVEVGARDVPDRIDHDHDHQAEADRHADVAELMRRGVDHDRPAAGEHQREGADQLGQGLSCQPDRH